MDWAEILKLLAAGLVGGGTALLKDLIVGRQARGAKEIERDAALEAKKLDDAAAIRKELRDEVSRLNNVIGALDKDVRQLSEENERARVHITDLQIALRRYVSRIGECAEVLTDLMEAEEHLDAGHVRRAKAILKLIENDRQMRKHLLEEESPEVVG